MSQSGWRCLEWENNVCLFSPNQDQVLLEQNAGSKNQIRVQCGLVFGVSDPVRVRAAV
ncbi:hypothetical protein DPMN_077446 [Dreissena polymorpha]|uniref:Uncharacterized protein n=1 Tax=Dreissena polymorpha TaxID=45954 RepID=A0A9D3YPB5_DREPO|nr:hypothetical protein DPMN_077446 [Dreissena polymorpha]